MFLDEDELDIQHLPAHLHLLPVSLKDYLDLPNKADNRYEYVDGLLRFRPGMEDTQHGQILDHLRARLEVLLGQIDHHMQVCTKTKVEISSSSPVRIPRHYHVCLYISRKSINRFVGKVIFLEFGESLRILDIIVGAYTSAASRSSDLPNSKNMTFLISRLPPVMVVEITSSSNRMNDILIKSKEYFSTGIKVYVIVDRERTHSHAQHCVRVRTGTRSATRRPDYSQENVYTGTDCVKCLFLDRSCSAFSFARASAPPV